MGLFIFSLSTLDKRPRTGQTPYRGITYRGSDPIALVPVQVLCESLASHYRLIMPETALIDGFCEPVSSASGYEIIAAFSCI